ncbi:Rhs element Vgr protein [Pseudoduganella sp. DS3]|uniref:Rhs element Vgr protein n=1 Tax=Pseudoduganella guangdongensis TaxID=2692179 RepID=A0A6N9HEI8_9BURK|nr:Rhs element Vgr protein [Pseudoduganella guangdongensis]MYN01934.1 Rhs element Vgr protein [Pseudoduganella guangdongensis]
MAIIARPLTSGEIALARQVFGSAIDYKRVRVHNTRFIPFLQRKDVCITPNGELYFHASRYRDDFAAASGQEQHWFMHEMAHVWQHQLGYPVLWRGAIRLGLSYDYEPSPALRLRDFNMEAQAEVLADYFALAYLQKVDAGVHADMLRDFLRDPASPANLPRLA